MTAEVHELADVLAFWRHQQSIYGYPVMALSLCGRETALDLTVWNYLTSNQRMLSEMSGVYCGLSIAGEVDDSGEVRSPDAPSRLSYVHGVTHSALGARHVYELCHRLDIDLGAMPALLLIAEPARSQDRLVLAFPQLVKDVAERHIPDRLTQFFRILFTACRRANDVRADRRMQSVRNAIENEDLPGSENWLGQVSKTGVIAQVIEGIVRGLPQ